ncbi:HWE histidine kinase domain-containing protein [Erythrobacter sp. CCH5-A1]|jgi:light-regulated signal transduction histidine kinase (bacteriophytochrome)|uniref:HWE histidine kinase domain-containing protein n=1 Tax=Erythrobacter sp. CCH5-A1 TaxID=1768792 RepID=UPI000836124A|nr:HWE histidine kinase domain-containing protein [Erythrobacter sp. CCH5-A1]
MNLHQRPDALTACDREAIHHIAAIQSFGGLIAADAAGRTVHISANLAEMLGLPALPPTGTPLAEIFSPQALETIRAALAGLLGIDTLGRRFGLDLTGSGALFDCAVHLSCGLSVIEFEPHARNEFADHVSMIVPVIAQLETASTLTALCDKAARLVRQMTGYDRVMIYRFHPDESGEVIAEDRDDALEPYKGLRYPAADIPQQARELFRRNRFRIIADMDAAAVPIVPEFGPEDEPLDMAMSMLRAHSKMHLAYMRNMGVGASLAIAIVRHDRLWGMISCHHRTPRLPAYSLRTVAELLSQTFSLMLDRILVAQAEGLRERARQLNDRLLLRLAGGVTLADSLPMIEELLTGTIPHDGISLFADGEYRASGEAPEEAEFRSIAPLLASTLGGATHATTRLADQIPDAAAFAARAAGALVLPLSRGTRDSLVLWRRPLERVVTWAGDPAKAAAAPGEMLQPRASFAAWAETVRGRSADWTPEECEIAARLRRTLIEVILRMSEDLSRERARAAQQQDLLIAELNHRVRNILGLIRALVSQSQAEALSVPGFAAIIGGRIAALAAAHDNITAKNWGPASLTKLIEAELAPYSGAQRARFRLSGEDVLVAPEAYTILALVVHELATNSAKYGSLSARAGRVEVSLARTAFGDLALRWRESGGPPVTAPTRHGFGSTIITRSIPHDLQGEADVRYKLSGVEAEFLVPARYLAAPDAEGRRMPAPPADPMRADRLPPDAPARVLVVEDSIIIALDTEENLKRLGVAEVRLESSVTGALAAIADDPPDFAIIDFNLGGESSEPIADALRAAGVRFVLATGYAEGAGQFDRLGAEAVLRKPYGMTEIERLLVGA